MSLCDRCIHRDVCVNEDAVGRVKMCDDFIDKSILSVPERKKTMKLSEVYKMLGADMRGE